MNFVNKVKNTIARKQWFYTDEPIIVAVSGGPDSVALLHVLHEIYEKRKKIVVAHVNHQFRGAESDGEAEFVHQLAASLGMPCEIAEINVPHYIETQRTNPQAAARKLRYEFLQQTAEKYSTPWIVLAHHADDQAETVLMRFIRGTGLGGLAGMSEERFEKKMKLIRPFLRINKKDILGFCKDRHLAYCEDSSNALTKYSRNRIRLEVIPFLEQMNPQLTENMNRLADIVRSEDEFLTEQAIRFFQQIVNREKEYVSFSRKDFIAIPLALQRRMIKLILNHLQINDNDDQYDFKCVETLRNAIIQDQTASMEVPIHSYLRLRKEYDDIQMGNLPVVPFLELSCLEIFPQSESRFVIWNGYKLSYQVQDKLNTELNSNDIAVFDADEIHFPLVVRTRWQGDRMKLYGSGGTKKLKDIFIDMKIPPTERAGVPIIQDQSGRILWIAGIKRSAHALVTNHTSKFVYLHCMKQSFDE